ncbi:phosphatase PAP2 family protein [Lysinibacillus capsici]
MSLWLLKKGKWILWILLAILVGISRIWIGVHYPLEVIVGALIGIISAIIIYFTLSKLTLRERNYRLLEKLE